MSTKTLKQVLSNPRMFILPTKEQAKAKETLAKATITSSSGVADAWYDIGTNSWQKLGPQKLGAQVMPKKTINEKVQEGSAILDAIRKRKEEELQRIRSLPSAKELISRDIVDTNEYSVISQAIQAESSHGEYGVIFHPNLRISEVLAKEMISQGYKIGRWASIEKHGSSGIYISWEGDTDIVLCQEIAENRTLHSLDSYPNRDKWSTGGLDLNNSPF